MLKVFLPFDNQRSIYSPHQFSSLNIQKRMYTFEYKVTFLDFGCSNITSTLGCLIIIIYLLINYNFLPCSYTGNIFQVLIWCPKHLNNGPIYKRTWWSRANMVERPQNAEL